VFQGAALLAVFLVAAVGLLKSNFRWKMIRTAASKGSQNQRKSEDTMKK
jgi:hypothetical protein